MNKLNTCMLSALLLLTVNVLKAQQEWCATSKIAERKAASNPALAEEFERFLNVLEQYRTDNSRATQADEIIYIPVVFHVVHNGDAVGVGENISEAQILSQIEALNRDFNFRDPDIANIPSVFEHLVADCKIEFCLAKFDPSGLPTTGIVRHQYSQAAWTTDSLIDNVLKPATIWDNSKYLNIWTVRMGGTLQSQGVLAYSSFPMFGDAEQDGIVARYNTIGTVGGGFLNGYEKGKTVSHEVGHYLGLLHVWGFNDGCGDAGDFINDTPDQGDLNFGCPVFPHISCTNGPNGDMFMNYMDYTDDGCRNLFTLDQAARMRSTLTGNRAGITQSASKCFYNIDAEALRITLPIDTICTLIFKPVLILKNAGLSPLTSVKIYYDVANGGVQILNWTGNLLPQTETQITLAQQSLVANGTYTLNVTLANPNGQSSDDNTGNDSRSVSFYAYSGAAAAVAPFTEGFETALLNGNWSIQNTNNDVTWEHNTQIGSYGASTSSASINNLIYATNPNRKRDGLITDAYDFTNIEKPELKFDVAYARYSATRFDTLNVLYSLDCGSNWTKIWAQEGSSLATATDDTALFIPTANDWKTVNIPLLQLAGQNKVSFKFENVTGWGNALYLDDINIQNNPTLSVVDVEKEKIKVFPNPAYDMVAVRLPFNHQFNTIEIVNGIGEVVYAAALNDNSDIISTVDFPAGLYFVHVAGVNVQQTEKLLIIK